MASHGYAVHSNEEIMLIFGGLTARSREFVKEDKQAELYNDCEDYSDQLGDNKEDYYQRTCGEEILGDMWMYHIV